MRKNEGNQGVAAFRDEFKVPLISMDAEARFLAPPGPGDRPCLRYHAKGAVACSVQHRPPDLEACIGSA